MFFFFSVDDFGLAFGVTGWQWQWQWQCNLLNWILIVAECSGRGYKYTKKMIQQSSGTLEQVIGNTFYLEFRLYFDFELKNMDS